MTKMNKLKQVISAFFIAVMLFLNIWLILGLNRYIHTHLEGHKVLIHYHNPASHQSGNSNSGEHGNHCSISSFLTFLNDSQVVNLSDNFYGYLNETSSFNILNKYSQIYYLTYRRGPPCI